MELQLKDIELAAKRLNPILHHTELDMSTTFSTMTGGEIYLKCENRQKTGSFKIRGASNKIAVLVERGDVKSVVASSAGNHAQGVAYAAHKFGIPATIVMPESAPIAKIQATEGYGAKVILHGSCYDDAYEMACTVCDTEGSTFLHPYNDLDVIAGQGTLGLEILGDLPTADVGIVPAGGGGLLRAAVRQGRGVRLSGAGSAALSQARRVRRVSGFRRAVPAGRAARAHRRAAAASAGAVGGGGIPRRQHAPRAMRRARRALRIARASGVQRQRTADGHAALHKAFRALTGAYRKEIQAI